MAKEIYSKEKIIEAIHKNHGLIVKAADALGCNPRTIYNFRDRHPEVREALEIARERVVDTAECKMMEAIENGEAWAISLVLKTLGKKRGFVERVENVQLTDDQIDAAIERELESTTEVAEAPPAEVST